jgi:hypothetical protein
MIMGFNEKQIYLRCKDFGIEARHEVLDEGRKDLQESKLGDKEPALIAAPDTSSLNLERKFDYIWAFSVLIHMEDRILCDTLRFIRRHLRDNGCFYGNVDVSNRPDRNWQGFPVVARSLQFYEETCSRNGLHVRDLGLLTELGHPKPSKSDQRPGIHRVLKIWKAYSPQPHSHLCSTCDGQERK